MRQSLRLSFFGMKDEFGFLRRQILLFDRTKLGRVPRQVFWLTMAVYAAIYSAAFAVPFEVGFRLEVEPDSSYMKIFLNGWLVFFFFSIAPVVRLTRRRLHDAGLSGWWMLLGVVPVVGWAVVCVLLCYSLIEDAGLRAQVFRRRILCGRRRRLLGRGELPERQASPDS